MVGETGQYKYTAPIDYVNQRVHGSVTFGDVLAGYHLGLGALTIKAFAGASFDGHVLTPFDPGNPVGDRAIGAKGVLETWLNIDSSNWAALDLSWSTAHDSYFSRLRLGHRLGELLAPALSLGLEAGASGNRASDNGRVGGFVRYEWDGGEISGSGGVTGDIARPSTPYATLVYLSRF